MELSERNVQRLSGEVRSDSVNVATGLVESSVPDLLELASILRVSKETVGSVLRANSQVLLSVVPPEVAARL